MPVIKLSISVEREQFNTLCQQVKTTSASKAIQIAVKHYLDCVVEGEWEKAWCISSWK